MLFSDLWPYFVGYFLVVNLITWMLFRSDKQRAIDQRWRIPEQSLLRWAAIGGWPAALVARAWFRHKIRKQPFTARLFRTAGFQLTGTVGIVLLSSSGLIPTPGSERYAQMLNAFDRPQSQQQDDQRPRISTRLPQIAN